MPILSDGRFQPEMRNPYFSTPGINNPASPVPQARGAAVPALAPSDPGPANVAPAQPAPSPQPLQGQQAPPPQAAGQQMAQVQQQLGAPPARSILNPPNQQPQMFQNFAPPQQQQWQQQEPQYQQPQFAQVQNGQQQQYQQPRSLTQQVGRGGAQSVQNYLTALGQSRSGGNNSMMNAPGQLGATSNVGFTGMSQQQPGWGPTYVPQGYTGMVSAGPSNVYSTGQAYNPNIQYQQNQAFLGQNYNADNAAYQGGYYQQESPALQMARQAAAQRGWVGAGGVTSGGTGGVAGQGQYTIPEAWRNIANADQGVPGSQRANSGDEQYTAGTYNRPKDGKQPGAYTPGAMYTDRPPEGTYDPNDGKETSDERAKTNISDAKGELQEFLDHLGVYSYEYKDKVHGEGRYISPMAQEFEKSKLGAQAVETGHDGLKRVNYGRLIGVQSAALALLNHKYNALENKFNAAIKANLKNRKK